MSAAPVIPFRPRETRKLEARQERASELLVRENIDRAADILDRLDERIAMIDRQIARLQASKRVACERIEHLTDAVLARMEGDELLGLHRGFAKRLNPAKLLIDNEALIPADFFREKLVREPDKKAIKDALAQGEDIDGVRLAQGISLKRT